MNKPTLFDGITLAVIISLGAAAASLLLGGFLVYAILFELLLYGATLTYLLYLMRRGHARIGRVVVISLWALVSAGSWLVDLALLDQVLLQAGIIWLVRSLYFHSSLWGAALDFGLVSLGLASAAWAMSNTGSLVAAIWSFFLVQAMFCWLPGFASASPRDDYAAATSSQFDTAHRAAEAAVRKLSQP